MLMTVFDSFGYCRIGSVVAARSPISRISRLTTTDRTGRLMKISVKRIAAISISLTCKAHDPAVPDHAATCMMSVARWLRRDLRSRVGRNRHRRARLQLELADGDDLVARLYALDDFDAAFDPAAGLHESAHRAQAGLAVSFLLLGDHEHRVAVQSVVDRRLRHRDHGRLVRQHHRSGDEHAGL